MYTLVLIVTFLDGVLVPTPGELYYDQLSVLCAHNAYTHHKISDLVPNQDKDVGGLLDDGVRCFMLDTYPDPDGIDLCHPPVGTCDVHGTFSEMFNEEFIPFLKDHPQEIIAVFIEDGVKGDQFEGNETKEIYRTAFEDIDNIGDYIFNPYDFDDIMRDSNHWPPVSLMRDENRRLLIFTDHDSNAGTYSISSSSRDVYMMFGRDWTNENRWELNTVGLGDFDHNDSCWSRWGNSPALNVVYNSGNNNTY